MKSWIVSSLDAETIQGEETIQGRKLCIWGNTVAFSMFLMLGKNLCYIQSYKQTALTAPHTHGFFFWKGEVAKLYGSCQQMHMISWLVDYSCVTYISALCTCLYSALHTSCCCQVCRTPKVIGYNSWIQLLMEFWYTVIFSKVWF